MSFWNFIFGGILMLIWVVAGGFITQTNVFITKYRKQDPDMGHAWTYSFAAAFVTWFLVILFLILIGLAIFGVVALFGTGVGEAGIAAEGIGSMIGGKVVKGATKVGFSWISIGFFGLSLFLVIISGVLSAMTAQSIHKSKTYQDKKDDPHIKKSYSNAIIAAVLCLGAFGVLLIGIAIYIYVGIRRKHKLQRQLKEQAEAEAAEQQAIEEKNEEILEHASTKTGLSTNSLKKILGNVDTNTIINTLVSKGHGKIA